MRDEDTSQALKDLGVAEADIAGWMDGSIHGRNGGGHDG